MKKLETITTAQKWVTSYNNSVLATVENGILKKDLSPQSYLEMVIQEYTHYSDYDQSSNKNDQSYNIYFNDGSSITLINPEQIDQMGSIVIHFIPLTNK